MKTHYSTTETAKLLGYTRTHIKRLCISKRLRAKKVGNYWSISKKSIDRYMSENGLILYKCGHHYIVDGPTLSIENIRELRQNLCTSCEILENLKP